MVQLVWQKSRKLKWTPPTKTQRETQVVKHTANDEPLNKETSKVIVNPTRILVATLFSSAGRFLVLSMQQERERKAQKFLFGETSKLQIFWSASFLQVPEGYCADYLWRAASHLEVVQKQSPTRSCHKQNVVAEHRMPKMEHNHRHCVFLLWHCGKQKAVVCNHSSSAILCLLGLFK